MCAGQHEHKLNQLQKVPAVTAWHAVGMGRCVLHDRPDQLLNGNEAVGLLALFAYFGLSLINVQV